MEFDVGVGDDVKEGELTTSDVATAPPILEVEEEGPAASEDAAVPPILE